MDSFKIPMREIRKKYAKSELVMMAWHSREQSFQMRQSRHTPARPQNSKQDKIQSGYVPSSGVRELEDSYELPAGVNNGATIPKKFFGEDGEIDLRQVTGQQAVRYLQALGLNIVTKL